MVPKSTWLVVRIAAFASICVLGRSAGAAEQSPHQTQSTPGFVVPSFTDLTIKTRRSYSLEASLVTTVTTLQLRGSRERWESTVEAASEAPGARHASILQCDQRRSVHLNVEARIYAVEKFVDLSKVLAGETLLPEPQGPVVTTTVDAVDTGERRHAGRHIARQVRTTTVVSPSADANTIASTRDTVGWYIDLPGLGCLDRETMSTRLSAENPNGPRDRHRYETKGTARRGYAIEETTRYTDARSTYIETITLVELSDQPLDASLFDIPADFQPALPIPGGGVDLTKPDSVANRLHAYWDAITSVIVRAFPWSVR